MKKVFQSHDAVAHAWAACFYPEGRASNVFFEGSVIYSYGHHFPMAKLLEDKNICLFTTRGYSNSTSKHIGKTRRAVPHRYQIVYCDDPTRSHEHNLGYWHDAIASLRRRFADSKHKITRGNLAVEIKAQQNEAIAYCIALKLERAPWLISTVEEDSAAAIVREAQAKRDAEREANRIKRNEQARMKAAERLTFWRAGHTVNRDGFQYSPVALRINGDRIETSHGAQIPVIDAWKVWPMLNRLKKSGKSTPSGFEMMLGVHRFESFDGEILTVGCHKIPYSEIEKTARALGLLEEQTA